MVNGHGKSDKFAERNGLELQAKHTMDQLVVIMPFLPLKKILLVEPVASRQQACAGGRTRTKARVWMALRRGAGDPLAHRYKLVAH